MRATAPRVIVVLGLSALAALTAAGAESPAPALESRLETVSISTGERRVVHRTRDHIETLAYCAARDGEYDVYTIAADATSSADERRLTTATGLDDGPDFSPAGDIFFNSARTGVMRIWRMKPDGSDQRQVTHDEEWADWFPHPSPDGKWLVFLSYEASVEGHPPNKHVALRVMPLLGGAARVLVRLFGGQGTLNVPSWAPDSASFAFVSYHPVKP